MYGFLIGSSLAVALLFSEAMLPKKINKDDFWTTTLLVFLFSILGGRLYHVLDYWNYYSSDFKRILYLNQGGLGIFGALIVGIFCLYFYTKIKQIPFTFFLDLYLFWAFFIQIFGRIGNFFNKELYGLPTNSFFKVFIPYSYRVKGYKDFSYYHPLFFYEAFLDALVFIFFIYLYKVKKISFGKSIYSSLYFISYGFIRLILEPLRLKKDTFVFLNLPLTYIISVGFILLGLLLLNKDTKFKMKL